MGIELDSLFSVLTRIFDATRPPKVDIAGGFLLKVSDPAESDVKTGITPLV